MLSDDLLNHLVGISGCAEGSVSIKQLGEGENNQNFQVDTGSGSIVLRIGKPLEKSFKRMGYEAETLRTLPKGVGPKLLYVDLSGNHIDRPWMCQEFIAGEHIKTWADQDLMNLGVVLSKLHSVTSDVATVRHHTYTKINFWQYFIDSHEHFFTRTELEKFYDPIVNKILIAARIYFMENDAMLDRVQAFALTHGDLAALNILRKTDGELRLIDWEFAKFFDPAHDLATFYYDDLDYNAGQWRIRLDTRQQELLMKSYRADTEFQQRVITWIQFDKLTSLVYLCWKELHAEPLIVTHYEDKANLTTSLQKYLEI